MVAAEPVGVRMRAGYGRPACGAVDVLELLQLHPQRGGLLGGTRPHGHLSDLDRVHPERVEHRLDQ